MQRMWIILKPLRAPVSLESLSSSELGPGAKTWGATALEHMRPRKAAAGPLYRARLPAWGRGGVLGAATARSPLARPKRQVWRLCNGRALPSGGLGVAISRRELRCEARSEALHVASYAQAKLEPGKWKRKKKLDFILWPRFYLYFPRLVDELCR